MSAPRFASGDPVLLPRTADGEGIKVGERSTFHPGFAVGFGVDSNVFYEDRSEDPIAGGIMIATAWAGIGNRQLRDGLLMTPPERSGRLLDYNISAIFGFRQFLDTREKLRDQSRFSMGADLRLAFLPGRRFSIDLDETFHRLAEPRNIEAGAEFNFNRIHNDLALRVIGRPGGGRVSIMAGYENQVLWFQQGDFQVSRNDRMVNGIVTEAKWRFLPKSAVRLRYGMHHTYYLNCCAQPGTGRNEDNFAHRIVGGYRGQLLKKLVLGADFGWGLAYYRQDPNGPNFSGPIALLALDYFPTIRTRFHLSGERSFQDSLFGNYFIDLGGRIAVSHIWRWRMLTEIGASVFGREYRGIPAPGSEDNRIIGYEGVSGNLARRDVLATLHAHVEQPLGRFFVLALSYTLQVDSTGFVTIFANTPDEPNPAGFIRHLALLFGAVRF